MAPDRLIPKLGTVVNKPTTGGVLIITFAPIGIMVTILFLFYKFVVCKSYKLTHVKRTQTYTPENCNRSFLDLDSQLKCSMFF